MQTSENLTELAAALVKAQSELKGAKKDSVNPFHKSKYADLSSVWDACKEALQNNGLSVIQAIGHDDTNRVLITTMLLHTSGQWLRDTLAIKPKEDSPQGVGSAITYGRRYALAAVVGVSPEDDDAEAAQGRGSRPASAHEARTAFQQPRVATPQPQKAGTIKTPPVIIPSASSA